MILKGSFIKNTEFVYGVVIYSGHETKIMKNSNTPKSKVSNLMISMNRLLYSVMIIQLLLCLCLGAFSIIWQKKQGKYFPWLNQIDTNSSNSVVVYVSHVATFLIAYSQLIPINMYFGMEFIKLLHVPLIKYDKNMFDLENNRPTVSRTSELIEELGQVKIIFSDKTGTLTKNNMILKKVCLKGEVFDMEDLVRN
jgi:magnesium-transporting ATPase (P-type)